ncbi:MAG: hypothetical protein RBR32_01620 [Bacteroidales bacterium]|nr:hypothetical protein [Bacteroidales bacterium]
MLEIDKYIIDEIKADATIAGYTGYSVNDPRVYQWEPPIPVSFGSTLPAAIFYRNNQVPTPYQSSFYSQRGNIYYYFQIVALNKTLANQIAERLLKLFKADEHNSGFSTTNWRVLTVKNNGVMDGVNQGSPTKPLYVRNVSLLLKEVFSRTAFVE